MRWAACFIHFFDPKPLLLILFHQGAYILQEFWKPLEQFTGVLESIELFDIKRNLSMSFSHFKSCCVVPLAVKYSNSSICPASAPPPASQPNGDQHRCKPCTQTITPCTDHLYSSLWQHRASFLLTGQSETYMVNKSMHVSRYLARLYRLAMYCNLISRQCNFFCCALRYYEQSLLVLAPYFLQYFCAKLMAVAAYRLPPAFATEMYPSSRTSKPSFPWRFEGYRVFIVRAYYSLGPSIHNIVVTRSDPLWPHI